MTTFRSWMGELNSPRGDKPEWPLLLRALLASEFASRRQADTCYAGEVFKDRLNDFPVTAVLPEKKAVKDLYHKCRLESGELFQVGGEAFWLLGYEWPNQGSDTGMRADLVGLNSKGGLVVFEAKLGNNGYGPFAAVLEGLDYLACLTSERNFLKLQEGFTRWRESRTHAVPDPFHDMRPMLTAGHEVIVLATQEYYDRYSRSGRGAGWKEFAAVIDPQTSPVTIRFAECDFSSTRAKWKP